MENKISREHAELEFGKWAEAMDMDLDVEDMDKKDLTAFKRQKNRVVIAIERGALIFNDNIEAVYTPQHPGSSYQNAITFQERTGASLMAMDNKRENQEVAKTYAIMADMCGVPAKVFAGLKGTDIKVCEAIYALLMD